MNVSVFPKGMKQAGKNKLENITLRGFGGGWNAIETDLQMESTYLVRAFNFRRTPGGTQKIRYGSKWFADLSDLVSVTPPNLPARIIDMIYFATRLVCVLSDGKIVTVAGNGTKTVIWPTGGVNTWSTGLDLVSFVPFKRELIIHNGRNKPVTISDTFVCTFLVDPGGISGPSNVNTPIGQYGCVVSNYHCIANINPHGASPKPTTIFISSQGTAGTFPSDPAPNDAIELDVGAFAPQGAVEIRGIAGFRANLLIFFQDQTVIAKLGVYNDASPPVHSPAFPDAMPTFGILGHRCNQPVENDLLFSGLGGMASARRNLLSVSGTLETQSLSERIDPEYRRTVGILSDDQQLKDCFMVYDKLSHDMLLFTPSGQVFTYSFNTKLKYSAWSEFGALNVQCGCTSFLGRMFYADGLRIFQHGNKVYAGEEYFRDRIGNRDKDWANATFFDAGTKAFDPIADRVYICLAGHTSSNLPTTFAQDRTVPGRWEEYTGEPIPFELELPWLDSKNPMSVKQNRFISLATKGNAKFNVKAYVDNLYKNREGQKVFEPSLDMEFIGNEAPGHGYDAGPYGGGRRSNDPRLYKYPVKFKTLKVVIAGDEAGDLELVNMSFLFSRGKFKR